MAAPDSGRAHLTSRQMIAFKIGARARKFALEGCSIEGYDYLYAALNEARANAATDPEMVTLLEAELTKFEKRLEALDDEL